MWSLHLCTLTQCKTRVCLDAHTADIQGRYEGGQSLDNEKFLLLLLLFTPIK